MSRSKQGILNMSITFIFYAISMLLNFFSRKVFIDNLGENFIGLSTMIINILGFLNLAELGITSAIGTALYKPIYEKNKEAINGILSIYKFLFTIIGIGLLIIGVALLPFLDRFLANGGADITNTEIYTTYITYFSTLLLNYFITYKQILLTADQKDYKITMTTKGINMLKVIAQLIAILILKQGYIMWLAIEWFGGIIYALLIRNLMKKYYPWLNNSFTQGKNTFKEYSVLFKKIRQIIPHRLSGFVLTQTDNIVLFSITTSLAIVTQYGNYLLLLGSMTAIFVVASNGLYAGVGNLIAEGNQRQIKSLFYELMALYYYIGGLLLIMSLLFAQTFMRIWLGENFVLDNIIFYVILVNTLISVFRLPVELFLNGYLLYHDTWAPITELLLNLCFSIILGIQYGLLGIVLGTTISLVVIVSVWRPVFLFRNGFKTSIKGYVKNLLRYLLLFCIVFCIAFATKNYLFAGTCETFGTLIKQGCVIGIEVSLLLLVLFYLASSGMRKIIKRVVILLKII